MECSKCEEEIYPYQESVQQELNDKTKWLFNLSKRVCKLESLYERDAEVENHKGEKDE